MERVDQGAKWTWSALRPGAIIGFSLVRDCWAGPRHVIKFAAGSKLHLEASSCMYSASSPATVTVFKMVCKAPNRSWYVMAPAAR